MKVHVHRNGCMCMLQLNSIAYLLLHIGMLEFLEFFFFSILSSSSPVLSSSVLSFSVLSSSVLSFQFSLLQCSLFQFSLLQFSLSSSLFFSALFPVLFPVFCMCSQFTALFIAHFLVLFFHLSCKMPLCFLTHPLTSFAHCIAHP